MNSEEQRDRSNVLRTEAFRRVNERIDALAAAVDEEVAEKMQEIRQLVARLMQAEHADLQNELRELDHEQIDLWRYATLTHRQIVSLAGLSLVGRIRWFLFGIVPPVFLEILTFPGSQNADNPAKKPGGNASQETSLEISRKLH